MKQLFNMIMVPIATIVFISCGGDDNDDNENQSSDMNYKQEMRDFVNSISAYARTANPDFIIVPQNGQELVSDDGTDEGAPETTYLSAIDAVGREDLFYGYDNDNQATPENESIYMQYFLNICIENGVEVLSTDYCSDPAKMDDSYDQNDEAGYIGFAAPSRELDIIPDYPATPHLENSNDILNMSDVQNFLYLINPDNFADITAFITAVAATNYDLIIIDLFNDEAQLTQEQVAQLKTKQNGGTRLVLAYMSIGEAEDYRYYWDDNWQTGDPGWLAAENPNWEGNFKVKYWDENWQSIIFGHSGAYLDKSMASEFDGVYLDIIDAFEYFE